ncbi:MAG: glycosyl hydrolase 53 family protein [Bacteroidales bacterium]|nr:glycosyl hydrolase 53 family protein [Bacteroidales bacterium]
MKTRLFTWLAVPALLLCMYSCGETVEIDQDTPPPVSDKTPGKDFFYKGTTMSFASFLQDFGLKYRENGQVTDPYKSVANHGGNCVRLQLDCLPFDEYKGVKIDWQATRRVIADAKKARAQGLQIILTLKPDYDKFTSVPVDHNNVPPTWASLNETQLGKTLHDWVYGELVALAREGVYPAIVAVGNEVNLGFLKNRNVVDNSRTGRLLAYGFQAVRDYAEEYNPACLAALHIADPSRAEYAVEAIEAAGGGDYDVLALSYYPGKNIGHSLPGGNFKTFSKKFSKPIMVLETAHTFTTGTVNGKWMGDYCDNSYNYPDWDTYNNEVNYTPAMARAWLRALAQDVKDGGGLGLVTWGTESLPDELEGKETGHGRGVYTYPADWAYGSTWENNSYWDFTNQNNLHEGIDWMKDIQ